jgi:hypothetical protein
MTARAARAPIGAIDALNNYSPISNIGYAKIQRFTVTAQVGDRARPVDSGLWT